MDDCKVEVLQKKEMENIRGGIQANGLDLGGGIGGGPAFPMSKIIYSSPRQGTVVRTGWGKLWL